MRSAKRPAQQFLPFGEPTCALEAPRHQAPSKPARKDQAGPSNEYQYSFDFIDENIDGDHNTLIFLIEEKSPVDENNSDFSVARLARNPVEPIRFVPRRWHVYLDHSLIVYFDRKYGRDRKLYNIAMKLEAREKCCFGDIVQLSHGYLSEFLSDGQIAYLREKLRLVKDFDIGMKAPGWTNPVLRSAYI